MDEKSIVPMEVNEQLFSLLNKIIARRCDGEISYEQCFANIAVELDQYHSQVATAQFFDRAFKF